MFWHGQRKISRIFAPFFSCFHHSIHHRVVIVIVIFHNQIMDDESDEGEEKIVSNSSGERTKDTPSFKIQFPSIVHCLPRIFSAKWKFIISSHFKIEKTISSAWLPVEGGAELLIKHTDWEEVCLIVRLFANSMEIIQHSFFARKLHRCFTAAPRLLCFMWELCSVWRIYDSQTANS